jgi:hypothetical protein
MELKFRILPMATTSQSLDIYDSVLEAMPIDPQGILAFKLPGRFQRQLSKLARKNSIARLTDEEQLQMQTFIALETTLRALKAKALVARSGKRR